MECWVLEFKIDGNGIDFGLCVSSGQVFRWRFDGAKWVGVIGGGWFEVADESGVLSVRSNVGAEEFLRIFGLSKGHDDWFAGILTADPGLSDAVENCRGLRILVQDDPVEVLFSFLCSANNHVRRIEGMVGKLASCGDGWRFPDLEVLAGIDGSDLRAAGFGYRAERIPACAQVVLDLGDWLGFRVCGQWTRMWRLRSCSSCRELARRWRSALRFLGLAMGMWFRLIRIFGMRFDGGMFRNCLVGV
ncbi:hypothetical protein CCB80_01985 [Armatimonadetes bacterium Uphvl-Ar1]|nr:hypothetical protein CCB80_01985 [Armatimonadetes bacterium Uphvl-Ar1]